MTFCANCGAQLVPGAQFCPRCGKPVATAAPAVPAAPAAAPPASPASPASPAPPRKAAWWIVPLVIVGLVVIVWLLLAGLPFGRDEEPRVEATKVETIAEGTARETAAPQTGTIVDVTEDAQAPPMNTATVAPMPVPPPPSDIDATPTPVPQPQPQPQPQRETPARETPPREISEDEATNVLRGYITSRTYYEGVRPECVQLRASGYQNVGYGFSVWDSCVSGGGSRMLGRWRVDAKTREVFRQRDDGRYLRP